MAEDLPDTTSPAPELSTPPNPSVLSPEQSIEAAHSGTSVNQPSVGSSGVLPDHPDHVSSQDTSPTLSGDMSDQFNPSTELTAAFSFVFEEDFDIPTPALGIVHPSPLPIAESQQATSRQPPPQADTTSFSPPLNGVAAAQTRIENPPKLLAGVTDEPTWMKKKRTLDYFRSTVKFGCLSDVIEHWYELEGLLGFLPVVSIYAQCIGKCAHDI